MKNKLENNKDKFVGEVKQTLGKITGNETLELKGHIQSAKGDINQTVSTDTVADKVDDIKEGIAGKINDMIDKKDKKDK